MTSEIKVNKVSDSCGSALVTKCGSTITLGASGKTVAIASGASTSGMGRAGAVDWCTTIYTNSPGTITGVNGKGYFINTTSGAVTVTLPSSPSAGDIIAFKDYARTFESNNVTLNRNGSKMCGNCANSTLATDGQTMTLVYVDSVRGWSAVNDDATTGLGAAYISATGGTVTTSGNYKIHTFNSDANFVVSSVGNSAGSNTVSYMVVAGGGGSAHDRGGGAGAGGFRESKAISDDYTASPLNATSGPTYNLPVSAATYPVTVGGGGASDESSPYQVGANGSNSVFSTITSAGGGGGGRSCAGANGGSGGASGAYGSGNTAIAGGSGNTPPVSPPQGNNAGTSRDAPAYAMGGGGGATAVGGNATCGVGGPGGAGATTSINGSPTAFAGGGGGGADPANKGTGGAGGGGCGASGPYPSSSVAATNGTANTGGGGGGSNGGGPSAVGGAGGSGVVIIRYRYQ